MVGCSVSSTWMLLLLLPTVVLLSQSPTKSPLCPVWYEFDLKWNKVAAHVEPCPGNCTTRSNLVQCKCLNTSIPPEDCTFPGFFVQGLEALKSTLQDSSLLHILDRLIGKLNFTAEHCMSSTQLESFRSEACPRSEVGISPKIFMSKLQKMKEELKNHLG